MFEISLAQWSLRHLLRSQHISHLDFPKFTKETFGILGVEYVNSYFYKKATDRHYLGQMHRRVEDEGMNALLIMIDGEGPLATQDNAERLKAVDQHKRWITAAWALDCHAVRVNAFGHGERSVMRGQMTDSLRALCEFAEPYGIHVLIENHGGFSSDASWVVEVMQACDHPLAGTLPDFGNFVINRQEGLVYDTYRGIDELMPYARGVSAKCYGFGDDGNETRLDFERLIKTVYGHGFHGYVGIEWGGEPTECVAGINACKQLLEKLRAQL